MADVRSFAFYLPQFHAIPENDAWWGEGFTEWTNVSKAEPLFDGHQQPRLPVAQNFYNLTDPSVQLEQAELARTHGIEGFIYYHYWFAGDRLLEQPFDIARNNPQNDFPFALCWANESWQRRWDGRNGEILKEQTYSEEDDRNHIAWLIEAFKDPRYIRVDGKPLFLVYRAGDLPNCKATTDLWRQAACEAGVGELYLCRVESMDTELTDPRPLGFDASVEFAPDWRMLDWQHISAHPLASTGLLVDSYDSVVQRMLDKPEPAWQRFPSVNPGFDNTPRKGIEGLLFTDATPERYRQWVADTIRRERFRHNEPKEVLLFVNAWNEWGEGAILEPCELWGDQFLQAHKQGVELGLAESPRPHVGAIIRSESDASAVLQSITSLDQASAGWDLDVAVIDNRHLDHRMIGDAFPGLPIIKNIAEDTPIDSYVAVARQMNTEIVVLATSDIQFEPGWLDAAIDLLLTQPASYAVSPTLLHNGETTLSGLPDTGKHVCLVMRTHALLSGLIANAIVATESHVSAAVRIGSAQTNLV